MNNDKDVLRWIKMGFYFEVGCMFFIGIFVFIVVEGTSKLLGTGIILGFGWMFCEIRQIKFEIKRDMINNHDRLVEVIKESERSTDNEQFKEISK